MLKKFVRKNFYKEISNEEFEFLWTLNWPNALLKSICLILWPLMYAVAVIIIMVVCASVEFSQAAIIFVCMALYGVIILLFYIKCFNKVEAYSNAVAIKLHFILNTVKGKAITKREFSIIKKYEKYLFMAISTGLCRGHCYWVCFELLKTLKVGQIEFWSVQCFDGEANENKPYTMHVVYVKGQWAFDTFSARQYKVNRLEKIYKAIKYKTFTFSDVENVNYEEFKKREKAELDAWCNERRCYVSFGK